MNNIVITVIGIIVFVAMLPVVFNAIHPTYTLNIADNDSTTFTDEGAVSHGVVDNYPINGALTQCANNTAVLTAGQCNVSNAENGTVQIVDTLSNGATYNLSYNWEDASYLDSSTERSVASIVFTMVILGLFVAAAFMIGKS